MTFHAIWLDGFDEIACDNFDDLMHAQEYVLEHFALYQKQFGIDRVRVCNGKATYFSLERAHNPQKSSDAPDEPQRSEKFHPGIHVKIVANDGPETRARVDWPGNDDEPADIDARNALLQQCLADRIDLSDGEVVRRQARRA